MNLTNLTNPTLFLFLLLLPLPQLVGLLQHALDFQMSRRRGKDGDKKLYGNGKSLGRRFLPVLPFGHGTRTSRLFFASLSLVDRQKVDTPLRRIFNVVESSPAAIHGGRVHAEIEVFIGIPHSELYYGVQSPAG